MFTNSAKDDTFNWWYALEEKWGLRKAFEFFQTHAKDASKDVHCRRTIATSKQKAGAETHGQLAKGKACATFGKWAQQSGLAITLARVLRSRVLNMSGMESKASVDNFLE